MKRLQNVITRRVILVYLLHLLCREKERDIREHDQNESNILFSKHEYDKTIRLFTMRMVRGREREREISLMHLKCLFTYFFGIIFAYQT